MSKRKYLEVVISYERDNKNHICYFLLTRKWVDRLLDQLFKRTKIIRLGLFDIEQSKVNYIKINAKRTK